MDIRLPAEGELQKMIVTGVLAAFALGVIFMLVQIVTEQSMLHEHMDRVELSSEQITALLSEANGITRKAAEE